jgi:hypothetical protein
VAESPTLPIVDLEIHNRCDGVKGLLANVEVIGKLVSQEKMKLPVWMMTP